MPRRRKPKKINNNDMEVQFKKPNLKIIPLGGFVSMEGEDERSDKEGSFSEASVFKRIAIVAAGGALGVVQAYAKYINDESNVYVQRETISPHDAVEVIYEAGGVPVLAHPCDIPDAEKLVKELMNYGLRGIEAYHRKHSAAMNEYYTTMAEKYNLIVTGGSDFHSPNPNNVVHLGKIFIPEWVYDNLRKEAENLKLSDL